jgi:hypothetical protein
MVTAWPPYFRVPSTMLEIQSFYIQFILPIWALSSGKRSKTADFSSNVPNLNKVQVEMHLTAGQYHMKAYYTKFQPNWSQTMESMNRN